MVKKIFFTICKVFGYFLVITLLSFLVIRLAPSDPALVKAANSNVAVTDETVQQLRVQMGLTKPIWQQYLLWISQVIRGNFGVSLMSQQEIAPQLTVALLNSLQLGILSLTPSVCLAIPLAFYMLDIRHTKRYNLLEACLSVLIAVPSFVLAYLMMETFSVHWRLLPLLALNGGLGLILPTLALLLPMTAKFTQQLEGLFYSEMRKPYVHALTYRGISKRAIYYRHIMKNSAVTIVTMILLSFGSLMSGVVVIETIFYWPGVGKYLMDAISNRDYPVVQATICVLVLLYLLLSQLTEGINQLLHPQWKGRESYE